MTKVPVGGERVSIMFPQTNWTQVAQATLSGDTASRRALEQMCRDYRLPLVQFLRSRGYDELACEDLVQDFFLQLLVSKAWKRADQARGRFRSFLLGALMHVIAHSREKAEATKRGGQIEHVHLDLLEDQGLQLGAVPAEAERSFDSEWAYSLVKNTLHALGGEFIREGREDEFLALRGFLPGMEAPPSYESLSIQLGQPVTALRTNVHRMRLRFRELLRSAVARTVSAPHEVDEELAYLRMLLTEGN